jgi:hypothetical protein
MPNYCNNSLFIQGESVDVAKFYENNMIKGSDDMELDFSRAVPQPKFDNPTEQEMFDSEGWYDWNIQNWGTKWNANTNYYDYEEDSEQFTVDFDTAWSPPIAWLEKVVAKYPELTFNLAYHEAGMNFRGEADGSEGELVNETWDMTKKDLIELGYVDEDEEEDQND